MVRTILAGILLMGCASSSGSTSKPTGPALDIALPDIDGTLTNVDAPSPRGVVLLTFWATWCQPCQQELAKLNGLYATQRTRGLEIYAVNIDGPDTQAQVRPWVQREGYTFPILMDRETRVLTRYNPRGDIPYYVVLDASGKVLKDHQGYQTGDMEQLGAYLETVLPPA